MPYRPLPVRVRHLLKVGVLVLLAVSPSACRRIELEPEEPAAAAPANLKVTPPAPSAPPAAAESAKPAPAAAPTDPKPGWSELAMRDTMPFCVFSSTEERLKAPFIQDAKPQTLRAKTKLTFGVYGPWCIHEACDSRPTLQCWIDPERNTLVMNTRYSSYHKDGSSCTSECMGLDTSCETPELPPGKYTIRHGDKSYKLQIPSVLRDPCFKPPN